MGERERGERESVCVSVLGRNCRESIACVQTTVRVGQPTKHSLISGRARNFCLLKRPDWYRIPPNFLQVVPRIRINGDISPFLIRLHSLHMDSSIFVKVQLK